MAGDWRLILEGPAAGAWNMATDRALLQAWELEPGRPTLRIYGWAEPTLSVGYAQNPDRDLDRARCREEGIPIVRRPTGGRALLHDREVTYALVAPVDHPAFGKSLREAYATISRLLIETLAAWGLPREHLKASATALPPRTRNRSPACFAALNHGEITFRGKKLVGSAQRRTHLAFLQHGSIPLARTGDRFARLCRFPDEETRRNEARFLREHTASLDEASSRPVAYEPVARVLAGVFQQGLPGRWSAGELTPAERQLRDAFLTGS